MQKQVKTTASKPRSQNKTTINNYQYDRTFILNELRLMLTQLLDDETIYTKAQLFKTRSYSYNKFNIWKSKYDTNVNIQEFIKKIEEVVEARLVQRGLDKFSPFIIFLLKNNHNYTDQYQQTVDTSISFKINRGTKRVDAVPTHPIIDIPSLPNKNKTITSHNK